jgi:hypothetical protein
MSEDVVEVMAREIDLWVDLSFVATRTLAEDLLQALHRAGLAVVPVEPDERLLLTMGYGAFAAMVDGLKDSSRDRAPTTCAATPESAAP